ncbi:MAG: site-specific integrase [Deltaproteobacteria bacterium]|nr:site-specific integrase [Deltaproteobacteria bacterium]
MTIDQVAAELLAAADPRRFSAETHPVSICATRWAEGDSRRAMVGALRRVAEVASKDALNEWSCPWWVLRARHVEVIRARLATTVRSETTANRLLSALRAILKTCADAALMTTADRDGALAAARGLPARPGMIKPLEEGLLERLFAACRDGSTLGKRDAALIATLAAGVSRAHLVELELHAWWSFKRALAIRVGGKRPRRIVLPDAHGQIMEDWLLVRGRCAGPLFVPVHGTGKVRIGPLRPETITDVVRRRARRARVHVLPDELRKRSLASRVRGKDVEEARRLAGHSRRRTTMRYLEGSSR